MKLKQVLQAGKAYGGLNLPRLFPLLVSAPGNQERALDAADGRQRILSPAALSGFPPGEAPRDDGG